MGEVEQKRGVKSRRKSSIRGLPSEKSLCRSGPKIKSEPRFKWHFVVPLFVYKNFRLRKQTVSEIQGAKVEKVYVGRCTR